MSEEKLIIDKTRYGQLKKLLKSTEKNQMLAVNIIDNCDIKASIKYVLCLINAGIDVKTRGSSVVFKKDNVWNYIDSILDDPIPQFHDLNMLITAYENHCSDNRILPKARDIKFIAIEYNQYSPISLEDEKKKIAAQNKHTKAQQAAAMKAQQQQAQLQRDAFNKGVGNSILNPKKNVRRKNTP
jgi:hypothetical protein